jgi:hypothetical protein
MALYTTSDSFKRQMIRRTPVDGDSSAVLAASVDGLGHRKAGLETCIRR